VTGTRLGRSLRSIAGFAGGEAFDDAELEPVVPLDVQAGGLHAVQRTAPEVFTAQGDGDQLDQPLHGTAVACPQTQARLSPNAIRSKNRICRS